MTPATRTDGGVFADRCKRDAPSDAASRSSPSSGEGSEMASRGGSFREVVLIMGVSVGKAASRGGVAATAGAGGGASGSDAVVGGGGSGGSGGATGNGLNSGGVDGCVQAGSSAGYIGSSVMGSRSRVAIVRGVS